MEYRLNKYLALCGLGSRRKVEELIFANRVAVNGSTAAHPSLRVTASDVVTLDGKKVTPVREYTYLILNKPPGYVTTTDDPQGRPVIMDLVPEKYRREGVFPVGRLDIDTGGLLLLTNDGKMSQKLTNPRYHVPKEYIVSLDTPLQDTHRRSIEKGLYLPQLELKTRPATVQPLNDSRTNIRVVIHEGKNRQIRHTFDILGYRIRHLKRNAIGNITLGNLNRGTCRKLKQKELNALTALLKR